jgi:hypothetical protein
MAKDFFAARDGYVVDQVVADPEPNGGFVATCSKSRASRQTDAGESSPDESAQGWCDHRKLL